MEAIEPNRSTAHENGPLASSSRRRIRYRASSWSVQEFAVAGAGGQRWRAAALRTSGSLLLWLGAGGAAPELCAAALGLPAPGPPAPPLATALLGAEPGATALAARLAAALARPVLLCSGAPLPRGVLPGAELALLRHLRATEPEH